MRDIKHLQEEAPRRSAHKPSFWLTLSIMMAFCLFFGAGILVGKYLHNPVKFQPPPAAKPCICQKHPEPLDPLSDLDAKQELHQFYTKLSEPEPSFNKKSPAAKNLDADSLPPLANLAPKENSLEAKVPKEPSIPENPPANSAQEKAPPESDNQQAILNFINQTKNNFANQEKTPATPKSATNTTSSPTSAVSNLAKANAKSNYTIQISAFKNQEEAKTYAATLKRKGFQAFVVSQNIPHKGLWHRVRLGHFNSKEAAERAKNQLTKADIPGWIIKDN